MILILFKAGIVYRAQWMVSAVPSQSIRSIVSNTHPRRSSRPCGTSSRAAVSAADTVVGSATAASYDSR